jgi:hypothetical protein
MFYNETYSSHNRCETKSNIKTLENFGRMKQNNARLYMNLEKKINFKPIETEFQKTANYKIYFEKNKKNNRKNCLDNNNSNSIKENLTSPANSKTQNKIKFKNSGKSRLLLKDISEVKLEIKKKVEEIIKKENTLHSFPTYYTPKIINNTVTCSNIFKSSVDNSSNINITSNLLSGSKRGIQKQKLNFLFEKNEEIKSNNFPRIIKRYDKIINLNEMINLTPSCSNSSTNKKAQFINSDNQAIKYLPMFFRDVNKNKNVSKLKVKI